MNKKIFVVLGIIAFIVLLVWAYFYFEIPTLRKQKVEYVNLSLIARQDSNRVETGFIVSTPYENYEGNTSRSYELLLVPKNSVIRIKNINLENQYYFEEQREINLSDSMRYTIKLEEPQPIEIKNYTNETYILELYSLDARNIKVCLKWAINIINVEIKNQEVGEKPENYSSWKQCYDLNFDLFDEAKNISISYDNFGTPRETDYLTLDVFQDGFIDKTKKTVNIK